MGPSVQHVVEGDWRAGGEYPDSSTDHGRRLGANQWFDNAGRSLSAHFAWISYESLAYSGLSCKEPGGICCEILSKLIFFDLESSMADFHLYRVRGNRVQEGGCDAHSGRIGEQIEFYVRS